MTVDTIRTAVAVVVSPEGRLDAENAPAFEAVCLQVVGEGARNLIMDLTNVDYISSAGLGTILVVGKHLDSGGGKLIICGLQTRLKQIFHFAGFAGLFPIVDTAQDAEAECVRHVG